MACLVTYWGRKSWLGSIVKEVIRSLHDVVLDPYGGAGGLVEIVLKLGKRAIYNDINPVAVLVARYNVAKSEGDIKAAVECFEKVLRALDCNAYMARCPVCGAVTEVLHAVHDGGVREYLACGHVAERGRAAAGNDMEIPQWALEVLSGLKVKARIADLFTPRGLRAVVAVREALAGCPDVAKYYAIPLVFLLSRMAYLPPGKERALVKRNWKPSWAVPAIWVPRRFVEFNPCRLIRGRIEAISKCKPRNYAVGSVEDVLRGRARVAFINRDAASLPLPDESVDVVTDPPYPTDVQYGELYQLFAKVLDIPYEDVLERELIVNRARGRSLQDYLDMLDKHMEELHRVTRRSAVFILKDSKYTDAIVGVITRYFNVVDERIIEKKVRSRIGDHKLRYGYKLLVAMKNK